MISFEFDQTATSVALEKTETGQAGKITLGVANRRDGAKTCRLSVESDLAAAQDWVTIEPWEEKTLQPNERSEVTVTVAVPEGTDPGKASITLVAAETSDPDEDVRRSQPIAFEIFGETKDGPPIWPFIAAGVAALLIVGGVLFYLFGISRTAEVPELAGLLEGPAAAKLEEVGLALGTVERSETDASAEGTVLAQDPAAATEVDKGSAVNLTVATPIPSVTLPNLVGKSEADAKSDLQDLGVVAGPSQTEQTNAVAEGTVRAHSPAAGASVKKGSTVTLTVAQKIATVAVPNLLGQTQAAASSALARTRLRLGRVSTIESGRPQGTVVTQSPRAGAQVQPGTAVSLQIAKAPAPSFREDCLRHDVSGMRAERVQGRWKITQGSRWVMDFDQDARSARTALGVLQHYKVEEICYVGRPQPSMTYIKADGAAPSGGFPGEDCLAFNPRQLTLRQEGSQFLMTDGRSRMRMFPNRNEANLAMDVIKHYGFTHNCYVGRPNPEFSYLRK